jgi:hypothetical protein
MTLGAGGSNLNRVRMLEVEEIEPSGDDLGGPPHRRPAFTPNARSYAARAKTNGVASGPPAEPPLFTAGAVCTQRIADDSSI